MDDGLKLIINGWEVTPEVPLLLEEGRILGPVRQVAERLGTRVDWDPIRQEGTLRARAQPGDPRRGDVRQGEVRLRAGSEVAVADGSPRRMSAPARVRNGQLVAPFDFLAEALAAGLVWDERCGAVVLLRRDARLAGQVVVIDPGHGGSDPGAIGAGGICEKDVTLAVGVALEDLLAAAGCRAVLTRRADTELTAARRAALADEAAAAAYLGVHCNSFPAAELAGTETYFYHRWGSRQLAHAVHTHLVDCIARPDRGVREANFTALRQERPAVLVAVAFLSNPEEERLAADPWFRLRAALGLYRGMREYFDERSRWVA